MQMKEKEEEHKKTNDINKTETIKKTNNQHIYILG